MFGRRKRTGEESPEDVRCSFCRKTEQDVRRKAADLETALVIENRALLCQPCVEAISQAAADARDLKGSE